MDSPDRDLGLGRVGFVMFGSGRAATVATSVALAGFMVFVLTSSSVAAAPSLSTASVPVGEWAYGYIHNYSVGPRHAANGWVYQGDAVIGYSVILAQNQSATNASVFELTVHRTMGVLFSVRFCYLSCSDPTEFSFLSYHAWETTDSFANFTSAGQVLENGTPVAAISLLNSSSFLRANLTESWTSALPPVGGGPTSALVDRSAYLSAAVSSFATIRFAPPLGLFPLSLGPNATEWSSTSAFAASGSVSYSYYHAATGPLVNVSGPLISGHFTISPSGNVTIDGAYSPSDTVTFGGITYPALNLTVQSENAFSVREGFILVPAQADLFGSTTEPWSGNQSGAMAVEMASLDAKPLADGHFGVVASLWFFDSTAVNPADSLLGSAGLIPSALGPSATSTPNPVTTTYVQGSPEPVSDATTSGTCLTSGTGCPSSTPSASLRSLFAETLGFTAIAAIVGVIALVAVAGRRRLPPPAYPNANLYPPGAAGSRAAGTPTRSPSTPKPPPAEEDPLDHLW